MWRRPRPAIAALCCKSRRTSSLSATWAASSSAWSPSPKIYLHILQLANIYIYINELPVIDPPVVRIVPLVHPRLPASLSPPLNTCMHIYMCMVCMYVHTYIYIYIYTYIHIMYVCMNSVKRHTQTPDSHASQGSARTKHNRFFSIFFLADP
jgi:hypothetical protein